MAGGSDRDQVGDRVDSVGTGGRQDGREAPLPELRSEMPGVQPHVRLPGLVHPPGDRLRDHVARSQVGELVDAPHEAVSLEVDEERALTTHRLGDQRLLAARVGSEVHHGRVELHELQVAQHRAGAQRDRHAIAGRHRGVRGLREDLTEAAAGQHHRAASDRPDTVALALAHHVQGHPGDATVVGEEQVDGERVLDHVDLGRVLGRRDQGPLDLRPGRVTARVRDPVAVVAALAGEREHAVVVVVEVRPERDQLAHGLGALGHQDARGLGVAPAGAGDQGVALVLLGGVPGTERRGDAALGPLGRARRQHVLGDDQDLVDLTAQPQCGGQAGDPGADDHDVGRGGPPRCGATSRPGTRRTGASSSRTGTVGIPAG